MSLGVVLWIGGGCAGATPCPAVTPSAAGSSAKETPAADARDEAPGAGPERVTAMLPLDLPDAREWVNSSPVVFVEVTASGEFVFESAKLDEQILLGRLRAERTKQPNARGAIGADGRTPYERVIRVMDLFKQAGIDKLGFAVRPVGGGRRHSPDDAGTEDATDAMSDRARDSMTARDESTALARPVSAWSCAFPPGTEAGVSESVLLTVSVDERGKARWVRLLEDPGYGFGKAAIDCALRAKYEPGRNAEGKPVAALSPRIRVRFQR